MKWGTKAKLVMPGLAAFAKASASWPGSPEKGVIFKWLETTSKYWMHFRSGSQDEACISGLALINQCHAPLPDNLEYQFGAPAHRPRRQIPQIGAAGCVVPAGNQMHR